MVAYDDSVLINFNSHPHEEDDWIWMWWMCTFCYFNSHPHEEDDCYATVASRSRTISTHILTKRMTCAFCQLPTGG